jgi:hypothetical protein
MKGLIEVDKREYTIKETLDILDISRATLYNKLDKYKTDLSKYISTKNGKKYISQECINYLKKLDNQQDNTHTKIDTLDNAQTIKYTIDNEVLFILKKQLDDKDRYICELQHDKSNLFKEIENKNKQIEDQNRMLENNQVLLQQSQQKILYLEQSKEKVSWWQKIFS